MPPTMVTRSLDAVKDFQARHGAVVIKPLHGNGGKTVFRVDADGANLGALVELFGQVWPEPFMVQQFLPSVSQGDKRTEEHTTELQPLMRNAYAVFCQTHKHQYQPPPS